MTHESLRPWLQNRGVAVLYLNFGPYHVARLRAIAAALRPFNCRVEAIELSAVEKQYPWRVSRQSEPFGWHTLFPDREVESLTAREQTAAITSLLAKLTPASVVIPGWSHPFLRGALSWCRKSSAISVLCGDSTANTGLKGWQPAKRPWYKELVKRWMIRGADAAQASGEECRQYFATLGIPRDRIFLKYDVVDNAYFARIADETRRDAAHWRQNLAVPDNFFFYPARMLEVKNHPRLLDAYRAYLKRVGDRAWGLVMVGSGPDEKIVDERIAALASPNVQRKSYAQIEDVARYYGLASALLFPSWKETWGLIVNEAEAAGLPIVISSGCTANEHLMRDGENGFVFDPFDIDQMADCMTRMTLLSRGEYDAMCASSRGIVADWDVGDHAHELLNAMQAGANARRR